MCRGCINIERIQLLANAKNDRRPQGIVLAAGSNIPLSFDMPLKFTISQARLAALSAALGSGKCSNDPPLLADTSRAQS